MTVSFLILALILSLGVVALMVLPFLRGTLGDRELDPARYNATVLRDQLDEVARDRARGLIGGAEADAARAEIGRRLLALEEQAGAEGTLRPSAASGRFVLAGVLALVVPLSAVALYLAEGRPDLPPLPLAARDVQGETAELQAAFAETRELAERLSETPDDLPGWIELGQRSAALGQWDRAVEAYSRALSLSDGHPLVSSAYGEALVSQHEGMVTFEAQAAFESALVRSPEEPRARFYLGIAALQEGDEIGAFERWADLARDTPDGAPWGDMLAARLTDLAARLDREVPVFGETAAPPPDGTGAPVAGGAPALGPGGVPVGGEAVAALPPEERQARIREMVDGLAARLEADPDDLDGWLQLGRSRTVLGEGAAAIAAYDQALGLAPEDVGIMELFLDTAVEARLLLSDDGTGRLAPRVRQVARALEDARADAPRALWLLALDAERSGATDEAIDRWSRLAAQLEPGSAERVEVEGRIAALVPGN